MAYDPEATLSSWQDPQSGTSDAFLYDNQGERVEQQVSSSTGTTTTTYVDNLEQIVSTASGTTTSAFYYVGSVRIAVSVNGGLSYLAQDALGSTNLALNTAGSATAAVLDGPYGSQRYSSGSTPTDYGFIGQHQDAVTGLDYFSARYYDPVAGQFTSADTILPGGGYDILGLSRYAYVEGNPIARTDPSGHCPWCIGAVVGAVVGAGIPYGSQVVGNLQRGQSLGSALTHVDVAEIGKAALVGAIIGGTGGAATAFLGGGVLAGAVSWAGASGVGQVADNVLHGRQWHQGVLSAVGWGAVSGPGGGGRYLSRFGGRYLGRYLGQGVRAGRGLFHRASGHVGRSALRIVRVTNASKTRANAAKAWLTSWRIRVAIHGPHHRFPLVGRVRHVSITIWRRGVKDSHRRVQIPIFWRRR
jgi:RHS repeat-associated protein